MAVRVDWGEAGCRYGGGVVVVVVELWRRAGWRQFEGFKLGLGFADGDGGDLLFVDLGKDGDPVGGLVVGMVAVGFVQAEALDGAGEAQKKRRAGVMKTPK